LRFGVRVRVTVRVDDGIKVRVDVGVKVNGNTFKGKLGEIQIHFRKISLHQQKFLVVSVFSNSTWLPKYLKKCPK